MQFTKILDQFTSYYINLYQYIYQNNIFLFLIKKNTLNFTKLNFNQSGFIYIF